MKALSFYQKQLSDLTLVCSAAKSKVKLFTFLRLAIFITFSLLLYFTWGKTEIFVSTAFVGIASFLLAVNYSVNAKLILEKIEQKIKEINMEITQLTTNIGQFDCGKEFADAKHAFSYDLDLFTEKGMFAFVNRTSSKLGKTLLAKTLLFGRESLNFHSEAQQKEIIESLSKQISWMQDFRASASISSREDAFEKSLASFEKHSFENGKILLVLAYLIPLLSISALCLDLFDVISSSVSGIILTLCILPTGKLLKETNAWANLVSSFESKIKIVMDQLILIKQLDVDLLDKAEFTEIEKELKSWVMLSKRFDLRLNIVVSIPLNIFFAWDIHQRIALEMWSRKNKAKLLKWEQDLAEIEVLISAATLRFNYEEQTIFASIKSDSKNYNCVELAHPLIAQSKRVTNDFCLNEKQHFIILTGPNMAGKSTYLRSLGINLMFANAAFPVFAKTFEIPKLNLFSSMRTSDDLSQESSYFHAELSRLKFIQENITSENQTFVLLDEILKGTNSKDKEEGSKKFLQKMKRIGAKGIIATHDLSLCVLSDEDTAFINFYFDSTIANNELSFDYKLKNGICKNMNASFLLQKMNLVD